MSESKYNLLRSALIVAIYDAMKAQGYDPQLAHSADDAIRLLATDATGEKPCTKCGAICPLSSFYLNRGTPYPFCKDCAKDKIGKWRKANPDWRATESVRKQKVLTRQEKAAESKRAVAAMRKWRKEHLEASRREHRMASQLRRTIGLRAKIMERDRYRCLACGATGGLVIDHILPVLQGGDNDPMNLQTLCRSCNSKKRGYVDHRNPAGVV